MVVIVADGGHPPDVELRGDVLERANDVPRIDRAFLERERRGMPAARYRQEYECSFEEADAAVFAADAVSQAIDPEREPLRLDAFRRWTA
jgi:hypothetical protein